MACWSLPLCRALEMASAHFAICYSPQINSRTLCKSNFTLASALLVLFYQDLARSLFLNVNPAARVLRRCFSFSQSCPNWFVLAIHKFNQLSTHLLTFLKKRVHRIGGKTGDGGHQSLTGPGEEALRVESLPSEAVRLACRVSPKG